MKSLVVVACAVAGVLAMQETAVQTPPQEKVGPLSGGGFLLNSGWTIRPAGDQIPVDTFPMSTATSANGKYLLVLNGGYNPPSISVIDIAQKKEVGRTPLKDGWLGLKVTSQDMVYVGGGATGMVYEIALDPGSGALTPKREFAALPESADRRTAFVGDVALSPDNHILYAADLYDDSISVINLQTGKLTDHWKTGRRPYRILVMPGGAELVISSWGDGSLYQHDASNGTEVGKTRVGPHPTDMVYLNKRAPTAGESGGSYPGRIFVAAANTNNVFSLGVTPDGQLTMLESINVSMTPMHPLGMTPSAVAVNKEGTRLFVVCADANAVAEADISRPNTRVLGFIPTGWYPTAVEALAGDELAIANGKGLGSQPNPQGPNPTLRPAPHHEGGPTPAAVQYTPHIQTGTLALMPAPNAQQLSEFTDTVMRNSPYRDELIYGPSDDAQVNYFAKAPDHASPIGHVIYVIKENRTYDQVLGDMEKGNGDKSLNLFGEKITPNLHQLARDYILYDNFYENADVSADGHNWLTAAIAPDYTVKLWPSEYGHRSRLYNFEGGEPANTPPAGYIWTNALQAGVTVRDYGEWTGNIPLQSVTGPQQIQTVRDPVLKPYVDMNYRGFDLEYSDVDRAKEFIREWQDFDAKGAAPQLLIVRMGNDHTQGTKAGALTPISYAAQNDQGVGMVVDAVSHSKLWGTTAIFVIEDDAQNGPDHVDSHRAPVWVISPFTRRGVVDSTMYNQAGVLRTIELILGLRPMTHFDAAATPMFRAFGRQGNTQAFALKPAQVSLTERNPANGPGAAASAKMNFADADMVDDDDLTEVLWEAMKHSDPPPPTRSAFAH